MSDINVRSDAINVEQVMEQIRARIREKRGVDYTEEQIRELASVKLEKFLDPKVVRSDLLEQFQKSRPAHTPRIVFGPNTLFEAKRPIIQKIREWTRPILRLFFNPDPLVQGMMRLNDIDPKDDMYYELFHNLVLELTRASIEVKNLKMRVESLTGRLEFTERRARALESVVVYKPDAPEKTTPTYTEPVRRPARETTAQPTAQPTQTTAQTTAVAPAVPTPGTPAVVGGEGPGQRSRRRRRRRGRRGGGSATALMGGDNPQPPAGDGVQPEASSERGESAPEVDSHQPSTDSDADDDQ